MQLHIRGLDTYVLEADSFETIEDIKVKLVVLIYYLRVIVLKLVLHSMEDLRVISSCIAISCEIKLIPSVLSEF